ncbi:MAG: SMI1/KNR4 family protein [Legionella sp.]|uniref:SMI1/KNR4 family protein n=1 Tax=Legionella sp. TaxID=459 RepID=UPI002846A1B2|nr:SMI1/KNR4 family protein [Legionella sp.]
MNELSFNLNELKLEHTAAPANKAQIIELENYFDHPIPFNLKEIFRNYNGASLKQHQINHFYIVGKDKKNTLNIWFTINKYSERLGSETLPFAEYDAHSIYFLKWEHEQANVYLWSDSNQEITHISDSFDGFLEGLLPKI